MYQSDVPFDTDVELEHIVKEGVGARNRPLVEARCGELLTALRLFNNLGVCDLPERIMTQLRYGAATVERFFSEDYLARVIEKYPNTTLLTGSWLYDQLMQRSGTLGMKEKDELLAEYIAQAAINCWSLSGCPTPELPELERRTNSIVKDLNLHEPNRFTRRWAEQFADPASKIPVHES